MAFCLKRMSTEIPNTVMTVRISSDARTFKLLPPSTAKVWEEGGWFTVGRYDDELHIVDPRGRSALIYLGQFNGELHYRGTVKHGGGALVTVDGKQNRLFTSERCVGLHLTADGRLIFQTMETFSWKDVDGVEVDEVSIVLPAFTATVADSSVTQAAPPTQ